MIKKIFGGIGRVFKPFVNVPLWIGWKSLKEDNKKLSKLAKEIFLPRQTPFQPETFEEAIIRLNLNEATLATRQQYFKKTALIYLLVSAGVLAYAIYLLLVMGSLIGFLMTSVMMLVSLALSFKQHFWYIQIREKQLGLTFGEWFTLAMTHQSRSKKM